MVFFCCGYHRNSNRLKEKAKASKNGGTMAKDARFALKAKTGKNVVIGANFLATQKGTKKLKS